MKLNLPKIFDLDSVPDFMLASTPVVEKLDGGTLTIDFADVVKLDVSGIGALARLGDLCRDRNVKVEFINQSQQALDLLNFIDLKAVSKKKAYTGKERGFLEKLGRNITFQLSDLGDFLEYLGKTTRELASEVLQPHKIRWADTLFYIEKTGVNAVPIVALISFLLGLIIAFQSADQLAQFGANIFVVDLVALSMTRELGPLITSIIIAGRSGSAFTAEIGTMKVSEEVDAMKVMGLDLTEYLVAPKFWALMVSLPLLAFCADMMGLLGGALIANYKLDIQYYHYMARLQETLALRHVAIGLGKCLVFAAIISIVGCYRGLLVTSGADSVGRQTTASVVMSIFFVIVADAAFSVIFTLLGI